MFSTAGIDRSSTGRLSNRLPLRAHRSNRPSKWNRAEDPVLQHWMLAERNRLRTWVLFVIRLAGRVNEGRARGMRIIESGTRRPRSPTLHASLVSLVWLLSRNTCCDWVGRFGYPNWEWRSAWDQDKRTPPANRNSWVTAPRPVHASLLRRDRAKCVRR